MSDTGNSVTLAVPLSITVRLGAAPMGNGRGRWSHAQR